MSKSHNVISDIQNDIHILARRFTTHYAYDYIAPKSNNLKNYHNHSLTPFLLKYTLQTICAHTQDIFLCATLLGRRLCPRLANYWTQTQLQLTQEASQFRVKCRTPTLILERTKGKLKKNKKKKKNTFFLSLTTDNDFSCNISGTSQCTGTDSPLAVQVRKPVWQPDRGC